MLTLETNVNIVVYTLIAYTTITAKIMTKLKSKTDANRRQEFGRTCVVYNLRRASRAVTQLYEEHLKPSGLLPTQFTLLAAVRVMGPVKMSVIAEELVLDRTTLTRNIRPLEREGLVSIISAKSDQRMREISITNKGLKKLEEAIPCWQEAQDLTKEMLSASRIERMLGDLRAIVGAQRKQDDHLAINRSINN